MEPSEKLSQLAGHWPFMQRTLVFITRKASAGPADVRRAIFHGSGTQLAVTLTVLEQLGDAAVNVPDPWSAFAASGAISDRALAAAVDAAWPSIVEALKTPEVKTMFAPEGFTLERK